MLTPIFDKFVEKSPISVMARGMIERVLNPVQLNQWYDTTAKAQYTGTLLFSSVFDIMNDVVCGSHHSVNAAFQASEEDIGVSPPFIISSMVSKLRHRLNWFGMLRRRFHRSLNHSTKQLLLHYPDIG